ncbi:isopentenyl-diphosphate delta-isomerase [Proteus myxofaciens ATCC 19692]|uniref:Isopentenyl-diphosphate delta-isomerase n=1 Tax=Proteus myxofaciens ATCC 19692 TaxID=1354337 RepID=A0A198EX95_9GAMM|nr:isopentenyl-diphosphate delta-isomerase [Proteus myxofaciens ATCC 19692]
MSGGLIEHEYDHIFIGYYNGQVKFNPEEVAAVEWIEIPELINQINKTPEKFTPWVKEILTKFPDFKFKIMNS